MDAFEELLGHLVKDDLPSHAQSVEVKDGLIQLPKLAIVDIENLCGKPLPSVDDIAVAKLFLDVISGINPMTDLYVIGCNHLIAEDVKKVWGESQGQNWKLMIRSGKDGADIALGNWLLQNVDNLANFESLILGSGDNFFAKKVFIEKIYSEFDPHRVLQIALQPQTKSFRHDAYRHQVAFFTEVAAGAATGISLPLAHKAAARYKIFGRKLLEFKKENQKYDVRTAAKREIALEKVEENLKWTTKHLTRQGIRFECERWIRSFDREYEGKVFLCDETFKALASAHEGESVFIVGPDGEKRAYIVDKLSM